MKNQQEYAALKNEISQCIQFEFVAQTTMITTAIAIFAIAFQQHSPWLFIITYLPLLYFQSFMNKKRNGRLRIAAYIRVFYDETDRWEKAVYDVANSINALYPKQKGFLKQHQANKTNPNIFSHRLGFISRQSSFLFSILSALCSIILYITEYRASGFVDGRVWAFFILVILNAIPVYGVHLLNSEVSKARAISKKYVELFANLRELDKKNAHAEAVQ